MRKSGVQWTAYLWGIPLILLWGHALLFVDYLVDDAAISFTYSRNLAAGHGLVSQPGLTPVEAFSNPLWVCLMALPYMLGWDDPYGSTWLLSMVCLVVSGVISWRVLGRQYAIPVEIRALILSLLATSAPLIRWSVSGMENGLYILGLVALWAWLVSRPGTTRDGWIAGLLAGGIALIRPDGMLYIGLAGLWVFFLSGHKWLRLMAFGTGLMMTMGAYLVFRQVYFGEWWPMPYYVKQDPAGFHQIGLEKWHHLFGSVVGPVGGIVGLAMVLGLIWYARAKQMLRADAILIGCWGLGILIFQLLPYDHFLGWYRYATPFMLFQYLWGGVLGFHMWQVLIPKSITYTRLGYLGLSLLVGAHVVMGMIVTRHHLREPIVPFEAVAARYGTAFNQMGKILGVSGQPILVPDAGGAIYISDMEVHDLIGLLDPVLAKTYWQDSAAYIHYLCQDLRPALIHVHGSWVGAFFPSHDAAFQAHYPVIFAQNLSHPIAREVYYIRHDLLSSNPDRVNQLKKMLENQAEIPH